MLSLVIGGAGSGKSALAESLCCSLEGPRLYIATMAAADSESLERVAKHRRQRAGKGFATLECPLGLERAEIPPGSNALLEDLSNLLANELFSPEGGGAEAVRRGLEKARAACANLTVVTNEVFSGGADYEDGTLQFLQELADLNRELAASADLAVEAVCGLPNVLKGALP
jgi:adenosylcobinamide kinase/adenosylcobinamide-phosphate guanylyltransferase